LIIQVVFLSIFDLREFVANEEDNILIKYKRKYITCSNIRRTFELSISNNEPFESILLDFVGTCI